ncbi:MAG: hypothetical protein ISS45_12620 [Candidatus Omnitrophica bacterium]|nr:hypothetical protein [Candidatus Omnitrophota bacterium]
MLYVEFKSKKETGIKKLRYARVLARIIREMKWFRRVIRHTDADVKVDYKVIFK